MGDYVLHLPIFLHWVIFIFCTAIFFVIMCRIAKINSKTIKKPMMWMLFFSSIFTVLVGVQAARGRIDFIYIVGLFFIACYLYISAKQWWHGVPQWLTNGDAS